MKILAMLALFGVTSAFTVFPQDDAQTNTENIIKNLQREFDEALMEGDVAAVDRILADDYLETTAQGLLKNKSDVMAVVRARAAAPPAKSVGPDITVAETRIRIYGDVALFSGVRSIRYQFMEYQTVGPGQLPPPTNTEQERFTKTYAKIGDNWRLVASQTTAVAKH
jgi:ketosteroid isomerase-like protein